MGRPAFQWPKLDDASPLADVIDALNRRLVPLRSTVTDLLSYVDQVEALALQALTWMFARGTITTANPDVSQAIVQRVTAAVTITGFQRPTGTSVQFIIVVAMGVGVVLANSTTLRLIGGADVTLENGEARLFSAVNTVGGVEVWQEVGQQAVAGASLRLVTASHSGASALTNITDLAGAGVAITGSLTNVAQDGIVYQSGGGGGAAVVFRRDGSYGTFIDFYTNANDSLTPGAMVRRASFLEDGTLALYNLGSGGGVVSCAGTDTAGVGFRALRVPN